MIPPRRLADDGTSFERAVLASSRLDAGSDEGLKRTLVAMGVGAAAVSTTTATAGASVAIGGAAEGASAAVAGGSGAALSGGGALAVMKWVGVAVVMVGTGAGATVHWVGREGRTAPVASGFPASQTFERAAPIPMAQPALQANEPEGIPRPPSVRADLVPTTAPVASVPPAFRASVAPRSAVAAQPGARGLEVQSPSLSAETSSVSPTSPAESRLPSSLDAEVAQLDAVRAALARGDGRGALAQLDAYDRAFPNSVLAEEAAVLRIDAWVALGDRATAADLSRRFLARNPSSPHASHLRQVIDAAQNQ